MNAQFTDNISVLELLWTLTGLLGIAFSFYNLDDALQELWKLRLVPASSPERRALRIVALGNVTTALMRLLELAIIVAIGVLSMCTENPPAAVPWTLLRYVFTMGLLAIPLLISGASVMDSVQLRRLRQELIEPKETP